MLNIFSTVTGIKLGEMFANPTKEATDFIENINLYTIALGNMADKGLGFINDMNKHLGLNHTHLTRNMGLFYQISNAMGFTEKNAYTLAETFTKLTADISSYYDISLESANEKLQAGLVGQTKPLRDIGIIITENQLAQTAIQMGIDESIKNMSEHEKILLRYHTIIQQASKAR